MKERRSIEKWKSRKGVLGISTVQIAILVLTVYVFVTVILFQFVLIAAGPYAPQLGIVLYILLTVVPNV